MSDVAPHKTVARPATARPAPAAAPVRAASAGAGQVQTTTAASPRLESPYIARFAGSIMQMQGRGAPAAERRDGDRMFRTRDGQLVELPDGVTAEDAAKLETEAKAAEKKLGQGPPPRPVPDVKKLLGKPARKEAVKPPAPGKRAGRAGKVPSSAAAAATAAAGLLRAVGTRKVAQYLAQRGAPALRTGISLLHQLRRNEQTHDSAPDKLHQSENSVVIPPGEGHAKSNSAQVTAVDARPAPVADEKKAKATLVSTLADNVPRSIEDVDNFKRDQKAEHVGAGVLKVVQGDSNAVTSTFQDVTQAPPPAPPEHSPEDLPPEEVAPATAQMNLGQGAVAPLQPEHTDVSNFTKDADGKLAAEGVTQQQLDMVDTGDLAEANKEKKGLEAKARTEPAAVQKFAAQQAGAVDQQLRQDERAGRDAMRATRKAALRNTAQKQHGTKTALEKKREEVAAKINGIYEAAQAKVKKKLADLETESMKRFDDGNAAASKAFEDSVHRELEAYKDDRYSGWFGWARKAKDWLLGMDELPGVKAIFERNRQLFVDTINRLVEAITADQKRVIQECKDELAAARKAIKDYVDSLGPALKGIGNKAAEDMTAKLGALDELVARKDEELQAKLKDKQTAAIKAIDEKIEKMKEEMSGALAKLGKLLLLAAKKFFTWALEKVGFSLSTIEGIINKGAAVLKAIFTAPIQFVKNLVRAASTGFESFGKNFLTHLKNAVFEWLTGSLEGLTLPATWDFKGILGVVFQMLGITYANFRAHLVRLIPEPVVKALETTFALVKTLVTEGPMAAWEQLKEIASEMKDAFIEAVKDWIKWKIVQKAIETVLAMFIPGAGIIRAIIGIYDTIVFFIQKAKDIMQMIGNFLGSIAEIAAGNIGAAAAALEAGLARGLVLVIDFLARFLHLSGITKQIRDAIHKVRDKVDGVIAKVAAWIVAQARKLGKLIAGGARSAVQAVRDWWRARVAFTSEDGQQHTLYFEGSEAKARLTIATTPVPVRVFLNNKQAEVNAPTSTLNATQKTHILAAITEAGSILDSIDRLTHPPNPNAPAPTAEANQVNQLVTTLSRVVKSIAINSGAVPPMTVVPGFSNNQANGLTVQYLFNDPTNHQNGTEASNYGGRLSGAIPILRAMGVRVKWVAFHILNHRLGGMAVDSNLVPTPIGVNNDYKSQFEAHLLTAYGGNRVLSIEATLKYRSANPEFLESITATSSLMKWDTGQNRWMVDRTRAGRVGSFSASPIPLPGAEAIAINHIPTGAAARSLLVRLTPMTLALLELIADTLVSRRVRNKGELIGLVRANVYRLEPANAQRTVDNYIVQIQATPMSFEE